MSDGAEEVFFFHTLYAIGFPVCGQAVFTPDIGIRKDAGERVDLAAQLLRRGFIRPKRGLKPPPFRRVAFC